MVGNAEDEWIRGKFPQKESNELTLFITIIKLVIYLFQLFMRKKANYQIKPNKQKTSKQSKEKKKKAATNTTNHHYHQKKHQDVRMNCIIKL